MSHVAPGARAPHLHGLAAGLTLVMALGLPGCTQRAQDLSHASALPATESDPRAATALIHPAELAAALKGGEKPLLLHVGFRVLYRGGAIPGSKYVGAGSTDEGLAGLQAAVQGVPRDQPIVLYCGCCPWDHCPNMRPAFDRLHNLGYTHVRALYVTHNLEADWVSAGYPIEKPAD